MSLDKILGPELDRRDVNILDVAPMLGVSRVVVFLYSNLLLL
jgi:hypothetical protein